MKKLLFTIIILVGLQGNSQEKIEYIDYETVKSGIDSLSEKKEYQKIIDLIDKVNKNDSLYAPLQINKSFYLMQLKKYEEAIKITKLGLESSNRDHSMSFYINQSRSYFYLNDTANAIKTLNIGLKEFPKSYRLYYNIGLINYETEKYKQALEMFKISAVLNPFNEQVHLKIGNICYKQHQTAQALMCFNMYLMLNPDGEGAFEVLNSLNKLLGVENTNVKIDNLNLSKDDDSFEEIDLILDNRIALNSDYEVNNEIQIAFVKQNHALLQTLNSYEGNEGFWDLKYVPIFKWISQNNYFDKFVYTTNFSIENPTYKKVVNKHRDEVVEFYQLIRDKIAQVYAENDILLDGKKQSKSFIYTDNRLDGIGTMKDEKLINNWEFFNSDGKLIAQGEFDSEGKRIGKWTWIYTNGKIKETANYKLGEIEGEVIGYYENGNIKYNAFYEASKLNKNYKLYNEKGALVQDKYFKNGLLEGPFKSFFQVGEPLKEFQISYVNGSATGTAIEYSPEGEKIFETTFVDGEKNGKEYNYYSNDTIKNSTDNLNNEFQGVYKSYFSTGILFEEGLRKDGLNSGEWKTYYPDGKLKLKYTFQKGEFDGPYLEYNSGGNIVSDFTYRNGELIAYKHYNKNSEVLSEARKKGGEFLYNGFSVDGNKNAEGLYNVEGGKVGEWKYYFENGAIASKGNFKNGEADGTNYSYNKNGEISDISNYKNGVLNGYYTYFYNNGVMNCQGYYSEDQQNKEWKYYYQDSTLKSINFYHKGNLHGIQEYYSVEGKLYQTVYYEYGDLVWEKNFDHQGKLFEEFNYREQPKDFTLIKRFENKKAFLETTYKFGVKHGSYKLFDFDGNKVIEGEYVNGEPSGLWTWYYPSGIKRTEATYLAGEYHGKLKKYYENGNQEDIFEYNLGKLENTSYFYGEDGKTLSGSADYLNDEAHGKRKFFSIEGKLQLMRYYEYGKLIGYSYNDKDGNEIPMIEIKNETAKIVSYFDNGKIAREMEFINGDNVNEYKSYYYDGNLYNEQFYIYDDYDGKQFFYYPTGKVKEENNFVRDELHGLSKKYYENGQCKRSHKLY